MATRDFQSQGPAFEAHSLEGEGGEVERKKSFSDTRSGVFEVFWIKTGKGNFRVDMHRFSIGDDMLYCLFPGQLHFFEPVGEVTGYRVVFAPDFLSPEYEPANSSLSHGIRDLEGVLPVTQLNGSFQGEIEMVVKQMIWEYNNSLHLKSNILNGLLKIFIACFLKHFKLSHAPESSKNDLSIYHNFIDLLDKKFYSHKFVNQYADELAVTPNYLSEVIKRSSGYPASYFIHKRLILESQRIAISSDISMKEIAFRIGFEDPSQFSKFFKLKTGTTFSEFRKTHN